MLHWQASSPCAATAGDGGGGGGARSDAPATCRGRQQSPARPPLFRVPTATATPTFTPAPLRSTLRHRPVLRELVLEMLQHLVPVSIPRSNDGLLTLEVKRLRRLFDAMLASGSTFSLESMQHCLVEPPTDPPL